MQMKTQTFFLSQNPPSLTRELMEAYEVLESCSYYSATEFGSALRSNLGNFHARFYNINGNNTNINTFAVETIELKRKSVSNWTFGLVKIKIRYWCGYIFE